VGLPDGGEIVIRAIEPGDAAELAHAYDQMSALSRLYITRGVPGRPAPAQLADVTHVEPGVHEALVALDRDGRGIGVARYARHPDDPRRAEVFCAVLDRWQRRGVGSALVERLAARAAHAGIERLEARVALGDEAPRRLLAHIADEVAERRDGGTVEITAKPRG
jgi:GNAT superfamily N-acetyltransferase